MSQKISLRTSEDIIHRLKWDSSVYDINDIIIGYEDRMVGDLEMPAIKFTPINHGGDLPYHRITYFRHHNHEIIWDRSRRIDILYQSGETKKLLEQNRLRDGERETRDRIHRAIQSLERIERERIHAEQVAAERNRRKQSKRGFGFKPAPRNDNIPVEVMKPPSEVPLEPLRRTKDDLKILTYNVLFDIYQPEHLYTDERRPATCQVLNKVDADILVLQEVTPDFYFQLMEEEWVKDHYYVVPTMESVADILEPYGQMILSRIPIQRTVFHAYSKMKRVSVSEMEINGANVAVAAIHLSADLRVEEKKTYNGKRRSEQLHTLFQVFADHFPYADTWIIAGDTNERKPIIEPLDESFIDAWSTLYPPCERCALLHDTRDWENREITYDMMYGKNTENEGIETEPREDESASTISVSCTDCQNEGLTFDPKHNKLAKLNSAPPHDPGRLDRIYVSSDGLWYPQTAHLVGRRTFKKDKWISDHNGLLISLHPSDTADRLRDAVPTVTSALCLTFPIWHPYITFLQQIRETHDPRHVRWPIHLNLIYGFITPSLFQRACAVIMECEFQIFQITFDRITTWQHEKHGNVVLLPDAHSTHVLQEVQARLATLFPSCANEMKKSHAIFQPHVTIGKIPPGQDQQQRLQLDASIAQWSNSLPVTFPVEDFTMLSRSRSATTESIFIPISSIPLYPALKAGENIEKNIHKIINTFVKSVHTQIIPFYIGSSVLCPNDTSNDIDVVCLGYLPSREDFFERCRCLCASGTFGHNIKWYRIVADAVVPIFQMCIETITVGKRKQDGEKTVIKSKMEKKQ